jgi:hypothetical protein
MEINFFRVWLISGISVGCMEWWGQLMVCIFTSKNLQLASKTTIILKVVGIQFNYKLL